ncbi:MAG: hypothetical protein KJ971_08385 [Firmicutes bacterium]|nr:hypothetical protein [Bacillota bacterium]
MSRLSEFKLKKQKQTKSEILKNWLSSFVITVAVVVVAVVYIPKSPVASNLRVTAFTQEVAYFIHVEDEDEAIIDGTLKIILQNQMEYFEYFLTLGDNQGLFYGLNENTDYQVMVLADKGFGLETLAKENVTTLDILKGAIIGIGLDSTVQDYYLSYLCRTFYSDPNIELKNITFKYHYTFPGEEESLDYQTINITSFDQEFLIENIPNYNVTIHLILEGTLQNDEVIILDELSFKTPLYLSASFYLDQVTSNSISVYTYADFQAVPDITYIVFLKKDDKVVKQIEIENTEDTIHYEMPPILFDGLLKDTDYTLELVASYLDPDTSKQVTLVVSTLEARTIGDYTASIVIDKLDTYYSITITVEDPNHFFQNGFYWIYEETIDYDVFVTSLSFDFVPSGNIKTATFIVDLQSYPNYHINLGIRSDSVFYYYVILDTIQVNE